MRDLRNAKTKLCATAGLLLFPAVASAGFITGHGRFPKIAGKPQLGYAELFEYDLFLSPPNSSMVGPVRRLGSPPGQSPTYDGFYRIDDVPAGTYSVYVNQPDFFGSPKVVPNVAIPASGGVTVNVNLDVDYSTYFADSNQWTEWDSDYLQTFTATGSAVRGISWRMAGFGLYNDKTAVISVLEENGNPNPTQWKLIGWGNDTQLAADSDEWVRFSSGQVPLTQGKRYAVRVHIDGGLAIYKRNKDANSYALGNGYDKNGNLKDFDLNMTVFVDPADGGGDDTLVTHTRKSPSAGVFNGALFDTRWGQSFIATGTSLAAVDLFAAGAAGYDLTWSIREGGPTGPLIGTSKRVQSAYFAASTALAGVSYNPGEVPLVPGKTYFVEAFNAGGFTPFLQEPYNAYGDGSAYRNGVASPAMDLAMTLVEYKPTGPKPAVIAHSEFSEPGTGAGSYTPGAGAAELGFQTTFTAGGLNPLAAVTSTGEAPTTPAFRHRSVNATTTFDIIDLALWKDARVSMMVRIAETSYEAEDFLRIAVTDGVNTLDLLNERGISGASDNLEVLADRGYWRLEGVVPESWERVRLVISSSSNSTNAVEIYNVDSIVFSGVPIPEPGGMGAVLVCALMGRRRR